MTCVEVAENLSGQESLELMRCFSGEAFLLHAKKIFDLLGTSGGSLDDLTQDSHPLGSNFEGFAHRVGKRFSVDDSGSDDIEQLIGEIVTDLLVT